MRGIVAAALATMALTTSTQQTFRVNVDAVRVDVLVMDGNRPVAGLSSDDFELRDSGVFQRLESVWYEEVPLSMLLALDASGSVRGHPLDDLKQAGTTAAGLLKPGDRGAVVTFAEESICYRGRPTVSRSRAPLSGRRRPEPPRCTMHRTPPSRSRTPRRVAC